MTILNLSRSAVDGLSVPGVMEVKRRKPLTPPDYIFVQNDTATVSSSPFYVSQTDTTHYAMAKATAPKTGQYIGAFLWSGKTNTRGSRTGTGTTWKTSDASVVSISSVTASGQAIVSILKAGTATLQVTYNGMSSSLVITAT